MQIGPRQIGPAHPPYIIAEIGVNHDGDPDRALRLVEQAAGAGADAVKLQHFDPARLLSRAARLARYQAGAGETDASDMLDRLRLSTSDLDRVVRHAHDCALDAIVTVFSLDLVDEADQLPWDAYKTASPDLVNRPLLERLAATARPLIVSTGAADEEEVREAVSWLDDAAGRLALLHCVSAYPTPPEHAALGAMVPMRRAFPGPIGYSDHTTDTDTGELAVRLHASVLEKHLTHDRRAVGPDHAASLEPGQLAEYVSRARAAWAARAQPPTPLSEFDCRRIGPLRKEVLPIERDVRRVARQSLTTTRPLEAGDVLTPADLTIKRPGTGIEPAKLRRVLGRTVARHVDADAPVTWDDLAGAEDLDRHGASAA